MSAKNQSPRKPPNAYVKYSTMAFQMAGIIGLGCWGGYKLDQYYNKTNSLFTIILSLVSIFAALYIVLKEFITPKN
jgi:hypothetical protein